jgi:hypothetical protein
MRCIKANLEWIALTVAFLVTAVDVSAQGIPRRDRSGSPRDSQSTRDRDAQRAAPAPAQEPFAALERELPSLAVDLQLTAAQVDAWRLFERDVRDVAEMDRARRRHLMSLSEGGERPPTAVTFIATLVEDDRLKAEATADLKRHLDVLYDRLGEAQRRTLDRRMVLSQTEPLGR